jgi:hypothetical protein
MSMSLHRLCLALALFAACSSDPPSSTPDGALPPDATVDPGFELDPEKSIIITNRVGFAAVADPASRLTLGRLLAERHAFMNVKRVTEGRGSIGPREGTLMAFTKLGEDTHEHNNVVPPERRIGIVHEQGNPFRDLVLSRWDASGVELELPENEKDGPFRLLAVINRIDQAGANDNPGGGNTLPEDKRKFLGEGRLVFGLTADDSNGEPYPMTLIMEYHLPFLNVEEGLDGSTRYVGVTTDFNQDDISDADWIEQRKRWASLWIELSKYSFESTEYQTKLRDIVALFARPENSVALRIGRIIDPYDPNNAIREFEYRESYTQGGFLLAPRDLARDVHPCVAQEPFFAELVEQRWQASTRDMVYDYKWPSAIDDQDAISDACGLPMGAKAEEQGPRVHVSRFLADKWWPPLYGTSPTDPSINDMEEKRHDFAMTTCSGCHSRETGTPGFMIFPRAENADSALAPFLRGPVTVTLPNGVTYSYNEIERRKQLLLAFEKRGYPASCDEGVCAAPPTQVTSMQEEMLRK